MGSEGRRPISLAWLWDRVGPDASLPAVVEQPAWGALRQTLSAGAALSPQARWRLACREMGNGAAALHYFKQGVRQGSRGHPDSGALGSAVERGRAGGLFPGLWCVEGLGYARARAARGRRDGLLAAVVTTPLPAGAMMALHAGVGLALATDHVGAMTRSGSAALGDADGREMCLESFIAACRVHASPGCAEIMVDALGLLISTLYPGRLAAVGAWLDEHAPPLAVPFWHGVGRGLYLAYPRALNRPRRGWQAVGLARTGPGHDLGRDNAVAGFAWALALVNIRHPRIVEEFLRAHSAELQDADDRHGVNLGKAFSNGVSGALLVWHAWAGHDGYFGAFRRHRPGAGCRGLWDRFVQQPCQAGLETCFDALVAHRRFGALMAFQEPARLRQRLEAGGLS